MPNSDLQGKTYGVRDIHQSKLGNETSYEALKMRQSRMQQAKDAENFSEFDRLGGEETFKYVQSKLKIDRDALKSTKKIGMDTGLQNQFIKSHDKDKENANPTGVGGIPNLNKGSINRKIMTNKEIYNENTNKDKLISEEIKAIRYLIEYIDNIKK